MADGQPREGPADPGDGVEEGPVQGELERTLFLHGRGVGDPELLGVGRRLSGRVAGPGGDGRLRGVDPGGLLRAGLGRGGPRVARRARRARAAGGGRRGDQGGVAGAAERGGAGRLGGGAQRGGGGRRRGVEAGLGGGGELRPRRRRLGGGGPCRERVAAARRGGRDGDGLRLLHRAGGLARPRDLPRPGDRRRARERRALEHPADARGLSRVARGAGNGRFDVTPTWVLSKRVPCENASTPRVRPER